jgi:hypothetical protein
LTLIKSFFDSAQIEALLQPERSRILLTRTQVWGLNINYTAIIHIQEKRLNKMMKFFFFIYFLGFYNLNANTGLAFLEIGGGARATGMGEAFTAVIDDPTSLFWNPAGSASLTSRQAHLTKT